VINVLIKILNENVPYGAFTIMRIGDKNRMWAIFRGVPKTQTVCLVVHIYCLAMTADPDTTGICQASHLRIATTANTRLHLLAGARFLLPLFTYRFSPVRHGHTGMTNGRQSLAACFRLGGLDGFEGGTDCTGYANDGVADIIHDESNHHNGHETKDQQPYFLRR
jgi:hypothetical protein